MSNVFTLDKFREETRRRFAPFTIELSDGSEAQMVSVLRLSADDRKTVRDALGSLGDSDGEDESPEALDRLVELISRVFQALSDRPAELLADLHDDDLAIKVALMSRVLSAWAEETQLGEA